MRQNSEFGSFWPEFLKRCFSIFCVVYFFDGKKAFWTLNFHVFVFQRVCLRNPIWWRTPHIQTLAFQSKKVWIKKQFCKEIYSDKKAEGIHFGSLINVWLPTLQFTVHSAILKPQGTVFSNNIKILSAFYTKAEEVVDTCGWAGYLIN